MKKIKVLPPCPMFATKSHDLKTNEMCLWEKVEELISLANEMVDGMNQQEKPIDKCCGTCKFSDFYGICINKKIAIGCMEFPIERKFWELK